MYGSSQLWQCRETELVAFFSVTSRNIADVTSVSDSDWQSTSFVDSRGRRRSLRIAERVNKHEETQQKPLRTKIVHGRSVTK